MEIKKCISLRRGYLNYSFESEPWDLPNDVVEACKILAKGFLIIEVFVKDPLSDILSLNTQLVCQNGCFNYYFCERIEFLRAINFAGTKHISIYSVLDFERKKFSARYLNDSFTFHICFENYLDTSHLVICRKYYPSNIETILYTTTLGTDCMDPE